MLDNETAENILSHIKRHDKDFLYGFLALYAGIRNKDQRDFALTRLIKLVEELLAMSRGGLG